MKTEDVSRVKSLFQKYPDVRLIDFVDEVNGVRPEQAWAHVVGVDSKPSVKLSDTKMAEALDAWWRIAQSYGLLSDAGTCLISIGGLGRLPWARIGLPKHASVLDIFAMSEGSPEFIVVNEAGNFFFAVTAEEDETWFYLMERQGDRFRTLPMVAGELV